MRGLLVAVAITLALIGCRGKPGQNGTTTINTVTTVVVPVVDVSQMPPEQWMALKPTGTITRVTIVGTPVVEFQLTDAAGNGIKGLGAFRSKATTATVATYPNLAFTLAKLVPEDATTKAPSRWVSYLVTTVPTTGEASVPTRPTVDNSGSLVDNGDGTYRYTFYRDITKVQAALDTATYPSGYFKADLGDVSYAPALTHRLVLQLSGFARGTGDNTADGVMIEAGVPMMNPLNLIYDFIPKTGNPVATSDAQRDTVSVQKCNECHGMLGSSFHNASGTGPMDTRACVVCHTDQLKYGHIEAVPTATGYTGETYRIKDQAVGDFPALVHRVHQGRELAKTGYDFAGRKFNEIGYSIAESGQKMCIKCHAEAPQADNWNTKPSRLACGSCHDGVDFASSHAYGLPPLASDQTCSGCHTAANIAVDHLMSMVTPHNPTVATALKNLSYEIKSATATATDLSVVFKVKVDGTDATFVGPATQVTDPLAGFTGSAGFLLAYAQPQEGLVAPADYNNLGSGNANFQPISVSIAQLLSTENAATMGNLAGPDGSGYYTATILGTKMFPTGATMRSVSLQGTFSQALASGDVPRHAISVIKAVTGDVVRRVSVESTKCANCHEWISAHGGSSIYEVQTCVQCHVPSLTTSGRGIPDAAMGSYAFTASDLATLTAWGVDRTLPNAALILPQVSSNFQDLIHGLHGGSFRMNQIRIAGGQALAAITLLDGAKVRYPGMLHECQTCHTYNGYSGASANTLASRQEADNGVFLNGANRTPADAEAALATTNAADLMTTPFTASCVSCHDSSHAKHHMTMTEHGGQIRVLRSAMDSTKESCVTCHGPGKPKDPIKVHKG